MLPPLRVRWREGAPTLCWSRNVTRSVVRVTSGDKCPSASQAGVVHSFGAWALVAVGDHRQHGGNDGYDDDVDRYYSWDSTVPNHGQIAEGDVVVLWDKAKLLGASRVDRIDLGAREKIRRSCPHCGLASLKARTTKSPTWKCFKCGATFDMPSERLDTVTTYRAFYSETWVGLEGLLSAAEVRAACAAPRSQLSLRPLDWQRFKRSIERSGAKSRMAALERRIR